MGIVSPLVTTYASTTPYITKDEFINTPTALDVADLIPGGTQAQQNQALVDSIQRASNWADRIAQQILAATLDTQRGRYRVNREGKISVPLKFTPVLEVQGINYGTQPSSLVAVTDFRDVEIQEYGVVVIPVLAGASASLAPLSINNRMTIGSKILADVTYVNGWANTALAAAVIQGANSIQVNNPLGIYPGSGLTIYDGVSTEQVQVANTYITGNPTIPLTAGTSHAHTLGDSVSNLPPRVKAAVVLLTAAVIQTRGNDAIVLDAMETPMRVSAQYGSAGTNLELARDMLSNLERVGR